MTQPGVRKFPSVELMGAAQAAENAKGLRLLVLHGSRARGAARADSDWDLAFLSDETFDPALNPDSFPH